MFKNKAQVRLPMTWAMLSHGRHVVASIVDGGDVTRLRLAMSDFPFVQIVRVVGKRKWSGSRRILPDEELCHFLSRRSTGPIREHIGRHGGAGKMFGVEERSEESRVHHHANAAGNRSETGRALMGAFEVLLELVSVYPQLPGGGGVDDEEHVGRMEIVK